MNKRSPKMSSSLAPTGSRSERVADQIWQSLAGLLQRSLRDPRISLVTISGVNLSPDLKHARVYFSVLLREEEAPRITDLLNKAVPYLRTLLAQKMSLRVVPQLFFIYDDTILKARHLAQLIG